MAPMLSLALLLILSVRIRNGKAAPVDQGVIKPCPKGVRVRTCKGRENLCFANDDGCKDHPGAACSPNYCGDCEPLWYEGGEEVNCDSGCPPDKPPYKCYENPCLRAICSNLKAVCRPNYCGGCHAEWFVGSGKIDCNAEAITTMPTQCPEDIPFFNCFVDPCMGKECPAFPEAECRQDFCGGCNAQWFVDDEQVDCTTVTFPPTECPPGVPVAMCAANPCQGATCANANATCRANYCGGCNAEWFIDSEKVDCNADHKTTTRPTQCPDGLSVFNCFVDPCVNKECPIYPKAECRQNYCGGCDPQWFVDDEQVDCTTVHPTTVCPQGVAVVKCFFNPCFGNTCRNPQAICRANYCGGCHAEWFVGNEQISCLPLRNPLEE